MSCTFWNLRRKKAAIAKKKAQEAAVKPVKETVKAAKPSAKKGGAKNGDE